ncbi:hypothetical protein FS837_004742, partial [Tulasnella sp. UAMH 9824]
MSLYRMNSKTIKIIDSEPIAKGGQGTIVVGSLTLPEEITTLSPGQLTKEVLNILYAMKELECDGETENDKLRVKALKDLAAELATALEDLHHPEEFSTWIRDKLEKEFLNTKYAIKKLNWGHDDAEESVKFFKSFVNELSLMAELSHPNIIKLIGFVEDMETYDAWIILPWEANGNVRQFLQSGEWDIPERMSLIQDVAKGVDYLHTREPPICHGDLKSLNILVNWLRHAVITDFGSARSIPNADTKDHTASEGPPQAANDDTGEELKSPKIEFNRSTLELTLTGPLGTLRWVAPEVLADEARGLPSDMWAVGWICWEIITGKIPFEELPGDANVVAWVMTGKLPAIRKEEQLSLVLKLCALMSDCWTRDPAERIVLDSAVHKPSIAPSDCAAGVSKIRSAELLLQLGNMYELQDDGAMAKTYFKNALNVACQTNNHDARADGLLGLGRFYRAQSRLQEAEMAFKEAHEIHARIGNGPGAANTLDNIGQIHYAQSRNQEAEKAFRKAHDIHARIGNDL